MMPLDVTPLQAEVALRAMKTVALADGDLADREHTLLQAAARALGWTGRVDELDDLSPEAAARALTDEVARMRLLQALELMALVDGRVVPEEVEAVARFARALALEPDQPDRIRDLLRAQLTRIRLVRTADRGTRVEAAAFPPGSAGRALAEHLAARGLDEVSDDVLRYELGHVIAGYGTDAFGVVQHAAFAAGAAHADPFGATLLAAIHLQLSGTALEPAPLQVEVLLPALVRGMQCAIDPYAPEFDLQAALGRDLHALREALNVPDLDAA